MTDDPVTDLRIIAKDALRLSDWQRAVLRQAADDLETAYKAVAVTHANCQELTAHNRALAERLVENSRKSGRPFASVSGSFVIAPGPLLEAK